MSKDRSCKTSNDIRACFILPHDESQGKNHAKFDIYCKMLCHRSSYALLAEVVEYIEYTRTCAYKNLKSNSNNRSRKDNVHFLSI